jgi:hypothetical protein
VDSDGCVTWVVLSAVLLAVVLVVEVALDVLLPGVELEVPGFSTFGLLQPTIASI